MCSQNPRINSQLPLWRHLAAPELRKSFCEAKALGIERSTLDRKIKKIVGVVVMLLGAVPVALAVSGLAGFFEFPRRVGPIFLLGLSAMLFYIGWNLLQNKTLD